MINRFSLLIVFLLLIFLLRVQSIGGLDPKFRDLELEEYTASLDSVRNFLSQEVKYLLPEPQASLLSGMVLGLKEDLPSDFKKALRVTSTIHVVVVSGQNLTLLGGFILALAPIIGRKKAILISLFFSIFYAFLAGLQVPVIRAALMVGFTSLAQLFGREKEESFVLVLAGILMLIFNPNWIFSVSFQLSFLATFGVVVVAPELIKRLNFLPILVKEELGVSSAAWLLTLPIIASSFHQISLVGILVNSLVLWTVPLIMVSGIITLIVGTLSLTLGQLAALVPGMLLTFFVYIVNFFASLPLASTYIGKLSWVVWIGYFLLILGAFLMIKQANKKVGD